MKYPHLYKPWKVRATTAANRLVMPAMATSFGNLDGTVSDAACDYLEERARGGFGIVITENLGVAQEGRIMKRMMMADDDRYIPGLRRLAQGIKRHGAVAIGQINHGGRQNSSSVSGHPLVAPSAIPCPVMKEMPRALEKHEISMLQDAYANAALRLQEAGFDGTEIHAAHGYLAASFMSPYSNHRSDEFGGSLDNRLSFLQGIIQRIRSRAGSDFLLFVRACVDEFVPEGIDTEQMVVIANRLAAFDVDVLSLSVGVYESYSRLAMISGEPEAPWLDKVAKVRASAPIPVIGVGRIRRADTAETAIALGKVDLVAIGRGAITDPDLPKKFFDSGKPQVVACMSCNICLGRSGSPEMVCPVNPFVGRERVLRSVVMAAEPDSIDILGGGFAALTAAWLAATRGFRVRVVADDRELAGMQQWRSHVPGQAEYQTTCATLIARAQFAEVEFVNPAHYVPGSARVWRVRRWEPAAAPTAWGRRAVTSFEVLRGGGTHLQKNVIIVGDDLSSVDAALVLSNRGHVVTLRTPARDIAFDAHPGFRSLNRKMLAVREAKVLTNVPPDQLFESIDSTGLVVGRLQPLKADDPLGWRVDVGDAMTAELSDAYEPGALTRSVYAAVELALSFCRESATEH